MECACCVEDSDDGTVGRRQPAPHLVLAQFCSCVLYVCCYCPLNALGSLTRVTAPRPLRHYILLVVFTILQTPEHDSSRRCC